MNYNNLLKASRTSFSYLAAPIISIIIFCLIFQIWDVNLGQPIFEYKKDSFFNFFVIKTIIDSGWFFSNQFVGFPHIDGKFYFHDFPIHADLFNFAIIKIFSCFTSNVFLIANYFLIFTFGLVSLTSFITLRHFKISVFTAILISILYAFAPYHLHRNTHHIFLSNYAIIPLTIMVSIWIATNKIKLVSLNKKQQFCLMPNSNFYWAFIIAIFAALSGVYYAVYSCIIFSFAWITSRLEDGKFFDRNLFTIIAIISVVGSTLLFSYLPSLLYWANNGPSNALFRGAQESFNYGLRISSLLVPVNNHYIEIFSTLHEAFSSITYEEESISESLGIAASLGFIFLILWLIASSFSKNENSIINKIIKKFSLRKEEQNIISYLASINIMTIIFATAGGLVMFIAIFSPTMRSHARFSIIIAFFSLIIVAIIYDKIIKEKFFNKKYLAHIFLILITALFLLDQTGNSSAARIQPKEMINNFNHDKNFIEKVEAEIANNSQIFILPSFNFPEDSRDKYRSMIGYLHSKNLYWSYPVIKGRSSNLWQENTAQLEFEQFIIEIKKHGFSAILINRSHLAESLKEGIKGVEDLELNLQKITNESSIISEDLRLVLYQI